MKKSLYLFGGLLVLAVAADLTDQGSGLIRVVADSLQFEFGHEVPDPPTLRCIYWRCSWG